MGIKVITATIFDPAVSGNEDEHARLELLIDNVDLETPSAFIEGDDFSTSHYNQLTSIFSEVEGWDDEYPEVCAAIYNSSPECKHPVVPVTVSNGLDFWQVFYMKVRDVNPILKRNLRGGEREYELLPDPTWAIELKHAWYFQHASRRCARCVHERTEVPGTPGSVPIGRPIATRPHRLVTLCPHHEDIFIADVKRREGRA